MKMKKNVRLYSVVALSLLTLLGLSGCRKDSYMLGIKGYNYTDRAIADFSANEQSGGNLFLSSETSGGGGVSCCVTMTRRTETPLWIDVRYRRDALESYRPRKEIEPAGNYITTRIQVTGPIPPDPSYLEIHFYPDQHIEAAISGAGGPSPPRLKLQTRSTFAR
jgi:hypothetical protein